MYPFQSLTTPDSVALCSIGASSILNKKSVKHLSTSTKKNKEYVLDIATLA